MTRELRCAEEWIGEVALAQTGQRAAEQVQDAWCV